MTPSPTETTSRGNAVVGRRIRSFLTTAVGSAELGSRRALSASARRAGRPRGWPAVRAAPRRCRHPDRTVPDAAFSHDPPAASGRSVRPTGRRHASFSAAVNSSRSLSLSLPPARICWSRKADQGQVGEVAGAGPPSSLDRSSVKLDDRPSRVGQRRGHVRVADEAVDALAHRDRADQLVKKTLSPPTMSVGLRPGRCRGGGLGLGPPAAHVDAGNRNPFLGSRRSR